MYEIISLYIYNAYNIHRKINEPTSALHGTLGGPITGVKKKNLKYNTPHPRIPLFSVEYMILYIKQTLAKKIKRSWKTSEESSEWILWQLTNVRFISGNRSYGSVSAPRPRCVIYRPDENIVLLYLHPSTTRSGRLLSEQFTSMTEAVDGADF